MAEKFGNFRWVKEGFLDNRQPGSVVGRIVFAALGPVDVYLLGDCKEDLAGKVVQFRNSRFSDEDLAAHALADMEIPQVGEVSLISFDPHPLLSPHPYFEWFSIRKAHYRIELDPSDAWVVSDAEAASFDPESRRIREALESSARPAVRGRPDSEWV